MPTRKRSVLVVDDDVDVREALSEALADQGFGVTTAANGVEALALLRGAPQTTAVLLDLMMPLMDGYGFLEEQQKDPNIASIPVAIVTAGSHIDRSRIGDGVPVVCKPVRLGQLLDVLAALQAAPGPEA